MTKVARPRFNAFDSAELPAEENIYIGQTYAGKILFISGSWTADRKYAAAHWLTEDGRTFGLQQQAAIHQATIGRAALLEELNIA